MRSICPGEAGVARTDAAVLAAAAADAPYGDGRASAPGVVNTVIGILSGSRPSVINTLESAMNRATPSASSTVWDGSSHAERDRR